MSERKQKLLNEMLKEIGYNDTPLRRDVVNTFKEWLDELNPDEISEDVHDFIMKTFKPKRGGWAKDISPIVWKFWNKLLDELEVE